MSGYVGDPGDEHVDRGYADLPPADDAVEGHPVLGMEVEARPADEVVIPLIGTAISLDDVPAVAETLDDLRQAEGLLRDVKATLVARLIEESERRGTKTLHLENGLVVEIPTGTETVYDAEAIEEGLRDAGMPEDAIREVVVETVSRKVSAARAKRAATANERYAAVIEAGSETVEKRSISPKISRPR